MGWPTIVRTRAGELIVVLSGDRDSHLCPWGKMEMIRSGDEGHTWSEPMVIVNTPLDDRDAGLLETSEGVLIVSWFTSVGFEVDEAEKYAEHGKTISQEVRDQWLGHWTMRSTDSGATWEDPVRCTVSTPHGPIELDDGRILFLGHCTLDGKGAVAVDESTDQGRSWNVIGVVPTPEGIGLGEPYMVEAKSGKLVGLFRWGISDLSKKIMWQSESYDGGRTWAETRRSEILGYPAHMPRLEGDRILLVYGLRVPSFGQRSRVSDDEGETWSDEMVLCTDTGPDHGYPASAVLADGSILTVHYQIENPGEPTCMMSTHWRLVD